ncbi:hypothetical protein FEP99_06062 [Burkholderia pseudomultivorans]|nr:hypothetical protein [Burkholderia pseudomultivorans]
MRRFGSRRHRLRCGFAVRAFGTAGDCAFVLALATTAATAAPATTTFLAGGFGVGCRIGAGQGGCRDLVGFVLFRMAFAAVDGLERGRVLGRLAALAAFAALTALLALAATGCVDGFRLLDALARFTILACFARLAVFTRLATLATFALAAAFTALPTFASLAMFTRLARFLAFAFLALRLAAAGCGLVAAALRLLGVAATAVAVAIAAALTALLGLLGTLAAGRTGSLLLRRCRRRCDRRGRRSRRQAEQALQPADEAAARHRGGGGYRGRRNRLGRALRRRARGRTLGRDALDRGFLLRLHVGRTLAVAGFRLQFAGGFLGHLPGRARIVEARVVVAQALELVVRRIEVLVRDQHDADLEARLDLVDFLTLFVEQEGGHLDRHLAVDRRGVFLHRFFLNDPQHLQRGRFGVADVARAVAARAGHVAAFRQRRTQALARQLHQAEAGDLAHLHACTVVLERVLQALLDLTLALRRFHVDEIDHDQAAEIAQAQLAGDFIGRFEVGAGRRFLDVRALGRASRVHVDRDERFGVVDHDRAARRQRHRARVRSLDLVLDLEAGEERHVVVIALHLADIVRHHDIHECTGLIVDLGRVDQDFADVGLEIVPDRADHEARFQVDQHRLAGMAVLRCRFDRAPQLQQVVQVPLQFLGAAADARGAGDHAHAVGNLQLGHRLAQFLALVALDPARHAAAARIVRHQHEVAAGERDEGREGRALVAALFLLDLDDQLLAFAQRVLDARGAHVDAFLEVLAGDFLERQEAVAVFAVVDEAGLERRLDAGDDTFVDIAFALFAPGCLDVDVDELLPVDDGDAQLLLLRRIEQHAFHERLQAALPAALRGCQSRRRGRRQAAPCCVVTSTLERERWRGELPEEALGPRTTGPAAKGHLRTRLQSTASTHRTLRKRAKPETGIATGARNASRAPTGGRCCGLGRSGEYRIQPDFPAWGVLPWFDVAKPRTLRGAKSGATP